VAPPAKVVATPGATSGSRKSTSKLTCRTPFRALTLVDDPADQDADAEFVDTRGNIGDRDPALAHQFLFEPVDRAHAEQISRSA